MEGASRAVTMMTPVYLSIALLLNAAWVWSAPVITAPWGQISGIDVTSPGGVGYSAYLAIPFALPPLGERRFAKPQPHPGPGAGRVFDASTPGYICPQPGGFATDYISEDCLTLNVGVPANPSGQRVQYSLYVCVSFSISDCLSVCLFLGSSDAVDRM